MAHRPIRGPGAGQITVGAWVPANWLVLAIHVVQYPPYECILVVGSRDDGVHFPPGFVLALPLLLDYPVMKGSIHVPVNQILLLVREEVLRFANVNGGNREALPPRVRNHAVDTHEVRGVSLFQAFINVREFPWPSLGWMGCSLAS